MGREDKKLQVVVTDLDELDSKVSQQEISIIKLHFAEMLQELFKEKKL